MKSFRRNATRFQQKSSDQIPIITYERAENPHDSCMIERCYGEIVCPSPSRCDHTTDNDYCAKCGAPQGSMREMIEDEMLLDEYPLEIKMKMTPFEIRSAIKHESM